MATTKKLAEVEAATSLSAAKVLIVQDSTVRQIDADEIGYDVLTNDEIDTICTL